VVGRPIARLGEAPGLPGFGAALGLAASGLAALVLGWLIGHGKAGLPAAAAVAIPLVIYVTARPVRGVAVALLIVLLVPASTTFASGKVNVIRLSAVLVAAALILDLYESPRVRRVDLVDWSVLAFAGVGLIGWLVTSQPPHSSAFAINYLLPFAFYAGARRFGAQADRLLLILFVGASLASLTVIYEALFAHRALFADPTSYYWNATTVHIFRPGGVFGSPPTAASLLAMTLLCGLPLLARARGMRRRGLAFCFAVSSLALILTFTRGPLLGFALGVLVYAVLLGPSTWARYVYIGGTVAVVITIVFLPRIETMTWFQKGVVRGGTLTSRQVVWNQTQGLITDSRGHELLGHGINSLVVGTRWLPGEPDPDIAAVPGLALQGAQNQYIRTLIEGGLLGLLLLLGWVLGTVVKGASAALRGIVKRRDVAALVAACVAFCVAALVEDALRQTQTFVVLALVTGLIVSLSSNASAVEVEDPRL
jgi:O-antigen ligase